MIAFGTLGNSGLNDDTARLFAELVNRIEGHAFRNDLRSAYYRGKERVRQLGIALPPQMSRVNTVVGWPAMACDIIAERLEVEGFITDAGDSDEMGITDIWEDNRMPVQSGMHHVDTMLYGANFLTVTAGNPFVENEPNPLITVEPPTRMSGNYDRRTGLLTNALAVQWDSVAQRYASACLFLLGETIFIDNDVANGWTVVEIQENSFGRIPVVRSVNKERSGKIWGTSEITAAVMGYTDMAVRTLLGMEVAREFYASPQRWILGADEKLFKDSTGAPRPAWEAYLGRFLAAPRDEDGELPQVGQFNAASPAPYIEQLRGLAQMFAAEITAPANYLGFQTDNPASADAIRENQARLVKRAEQKQTPFGYGYSEAVRLALMIRDGSAPKRISTIWRDAGTPTKAANIDGVQKLVSIGVLNPEWELTQELAGLTPSQRKQAEVERRRDRARAMTQSLLTAAEPASGPELPAEQPEAAPAP